MTTLIPADDRMESADAPSGAHPPDIRPHARREADRLHAAFFGHPLPSHADDATAKQTSSQRPQNERLCMGGHRETIFGLSFSPDGTYLASASQESSICIWDVATHRLETKLSEGLDADYECLRVAWRKPMGEGKDASSADDGERYLLASAGADGIVRLWSAAGEGKLNWECVGMLDHLGLDKKDGGDAPDEKDRPQIYTLQFSQSKGATILLTSANDTVYLWNIVEDESPQAPNDAAKRRKFVSHSSIRFSHLDDGRQVNQFGGGRNPHNELYVFDASYSDHTGLLGVALSDGTCRVLPLASSGNDGSFCEDQCVLSLPPGYFPGTGGHLTAISWDKSGTRLATCIASGRVVLWLLQMADRDGVQDWHPSCIAVLEGGHAVGRPLFGVKYCGGDNEELVMTWGVDGKVCVWDSYSVGTVVSPLCTLVTHSDYPIYALDITNEGSRPDKTDKRQKVQIALGGGSEGGFLGVPVYLYDV